MVQYLRRQTELSCSHCSPSELADEMAARPDQKVLFLIDAEDVGLADMLRRFDADSHTYNANHLAAVYNLERDAEVAIDPLVYNLHGLFFADADPASVPEGI